MKRLFLVAMAVICCVSVIYAQNPTSGGVKEDLDAKYGANLIPAGESAPLFKLNTPDGKAVSLSDFKGKYVVLDFWASWCGDCRRDIPQMLNMYNDYSPKGVQFIGVSFDDDLQKLKEAVATYKIPYLQVSELKKWKTTDIYKSYKISWIPTIYIIGPDGKVELSTVHSWKAERFLHNLYYVK